MTFQHRPVQTYRAPTYPREGYVIPKEVHRSHWATKILRRALLLGSLPLSVAACDTPWGAMDGGLQMPHSNLPEQDARAIVLEELNKTRLQLEPDQDFQDRDVSFNADGYDAQLQIGYEFVSAQSPDYNDLTKEEQETLAEWQQTSGPYFFVFNPRDYHDGSLQTVAGHKEKLRTEVLAFITFLRNQGIL